MFGDLLLYGLSETGSPLLSILRALPDLASHIESDSDFNTDTWAASHYALFGRNIPPLAGVFLDAQNASAPSGAVTATRMHDFYARIRGENYELKALGRNERADHLGLMLHALSFLTGAEADALRDTLPLKEIIQPLQAHQSMLLEGSLLPSLAILEMTLKSFPPRHGREFFASAVGLAHASCFAQNLALRQDSADSKEVSQRPLESPPDLEAPDTTTAHIVDYLIAPQRSGWFLSQGHIAELGRQLDLPRGFGDRRLVFKNLFDEAARFNALPALARALMHHADTLMAFMPTNNPWLGHLEQTKTFLTALENNTALPSQPEATH